tara:strand:+ start:645 stop:1775 length:1131 start_codon:yes stop_codon:yes gene_type:complete
MQKILIADDEANIIMLLEIMLKDLDAEVISAENGELAIQKAKECQPDLVITDVVMPKKNGFEVCRELRAIPSLAQIPIIILSALGDEYNKITGFEEGANEYMVKPFNIEALKGRVKALLYRNDGTHNGEVCPTDQPNVIRSKEKAVDISIIPTGFKQLDLNINGGIPRGSNILVVGPIGKGKSSFARKFIANGLQQNERCLFVALDDNPNRVRQSLAEMIKGPSIQRYEQQRYFSVVDAYSWSSLTDSGNETFSVTGSLELNQLAGIISDASHYIGQTVQEKAGGRRVIDSISSLLVNFELANVQRFLSQIARTSAAFGDVSTLFIIEEGTVQDQVLNNIKYIMDGVIEFDEHESQRSVRVASMKWMKTNSNWISL